MGGGDLELIITNASENGDLLEQTPKSLEKPIDKAESNICVKEKKKPNVH